MFAKLNNSKKNNKVLKTLIIILSCLSFTFLARFENNLVANNLTSPDQSKYLQNNIQKDTQNNEQNTIIEQYVPKKTLQKALKEAENIIKNLPSQLENSSNFFIITNSTQNFYNPKTINPYYEEAVKEAESLLNEVGKQYGFEELIPQQIETENQTQAISKKQKWPPVTRKFYVFISSSIPEITLRNYAQQALKLRAEKGWHFTFVMQGFVNGMRKIKPTIKWILKWNLKEPHKPLSKTNYLIAPVEVNPVLVQKHNIVSVPALIEKDNPKTQNCVVYGDLPLETLIEKLDKKQCSQTFGSTYNWKEMNALDEIKMHAKKWLEKNDIEKLKEQIKERLINRLSEVSCSGFVHARESQTYYTTGNYTLPFDIPDPRHPGKILYPKGFSFNPLNYVSLPGSLLIIDLSHPEELKLFPFIIDYAPKPLTVLLTGGKYLDIAKTYSKTHLDVQIYPGCWHAHQLAQIYNIKQLTPSLITQHGNKWYVQVFGDDWKEKFNFILNNNKNRIQNKTKKEEKNAKKQKQKSR